MNTPPSVSIPRDRGVTSKSRTSVTSPANTPPYYYKKMGRERERKERVDVMKNERVENNKRKKLKHKIKNKVALDEIK